MDPKLIVLLIMMTALTALSTDIYLPSMAHMARVFTASDATVGWTLHAFFIAFALGQLVFGPLSDLYGRRKPLLIGSAIYVLASFLCASVADIWTLVLARAMQGLGASSGVVICPAIVRDHCAGSNSTRVLAKIASATALAPIVAPLLGGLFETYASWRWSFMFLGLFGIVLWVLTISRLTDTRGTTSVVVEPGSYAKVLGNAEWQKYTVIGTMAFGGLFAFIASAAPIIVGQWGYSPQVFSLAFASNAGVYLFGSVAVGRMASSVARMTLARIGSLLILAGGTLMLVLAGLGWHQLAAILGPMGLVTAGVACCLPASSSGAVESFPHAAGAASALLGCFRFLGSAVIVTSAGTLLHVSSRSLGWVILTCGLISTAATLTRPNTRWFPTGQSKRSPIPVPVNRTPR